MLKLRRCVSNIGWCVDNPKGQVDAGRGWLFGFGQLMFPELLGRAAHE